MECRTCKRDYKPTDRDITKHDYKCKPCKRLYNQSYIAKRRTAGIRVSGTTRWDSEKRAAWRERYYSRSDVLARKAATERTRRDDPAHIERISARYQARNALRRGEIAKRPCVCGNARAEMHHADYSKPLNVSWLCRACHIAEHAKAKGDA